MPRLQGRRPATCTPKVTVVLPTDLRPRRGTPRRRSSTSSTSPTRADRATEPATHPEFHRCNSTDSPRRHRRRSSPPSAPPRSSTARPRRRASPRRARRARRRRPGRDAAPPRRRPPRRSAASSPAALARAPDPGRQLSLEPRARSGSSSRPRRRPTRLGDEYVSTEHLLLGDRRGRRRGPGAARAATAPVARHLLQALSSVRGGQRVTSPEPRGHLPGAREVRPRPHRRGARRQARPGHRPRRGDPAGHPGASAGARRTTRS